MNSDDPVEKAIEMFNNHPSILRINQDGYSQNSFNFEPISESSIYDIISNIGSAKAYQKDNIPPQSLKDNVDICSYVLFSDVNKCIYNGVFPNNLKHADITPTFKKTERLHKNNYRPVSICLHYLKFMRNYFISTFISTLIKSFQSIYVVSERVTAPSIVCYTCWNF